MNTHNTNSARLVALAAALSLPVAPAIADEVHDLVSPNTTEVAVSLQDHGDQVPAILRQYSGLDSSAAGSLDLSYVNRSGNGLWLKAYAQDYNLPTQSYGALVEQQGKWKVAYDHDELVRIAPYTLSTKVQGIGTGTLVLNQDFRGRNGGQVLRNLELQRTRNGVSAFVAFRPDLRLNVGARTEDKTGAIMSSTIGSTINNALGNGKNYSTMFFAPQPEDYRHRQMDASLDYTGKKLQLSVGYYGSYFDNHNLALNVTPGYNSLPTVPAIAANSNGGVAILTGNYAIPWVSLPPDNRSHQFYLQGGYSFSNATRLTFKVQQMVTTQDDGLIPNYGNVPIAQQAGESNAAYAARVLASGYYTLNPPGVPYANGITATSLNGKVVTTSYAAVFTSRITPAFDLKAGFRYQKRDDQTPQLLWLDSTASGEFPTGRPNELDMEKDTRANLELTYRLPAEFRLTGIYEYQKLERPATLRDLTKENTLKFELQRAMGESVNGWLIYSMARRTGGAWEDLTVTPVANVTSFSTATGVAAPLQFVDRDRNKLRAMVDFSPTATFSGQAYWEFTRDSYPYIPSSGFARMGMTASNSEILGGDLNVQLTRKWKATAYFTYDIAKSHQNELYTPRLTFDQNCLVSSHTTFTQNCSPWTADLGSRGRVFGVAVAGRMGKKLDVNADYMYSKDDTGYTIGFDPLYPLNAGGGAATLWGSSVPAGAGVLPSTRYSINRLRLVGNYPIAKGTRLKATYVYDERKYSDYAWAGGWSYSDGTRALYDPLQRDQMVALSVIVTF